MPTNTSSTTENGAQTTDFTASPSPDLTTERSFDTDSARAAVSDYARRAERIVQDAIERLRSNSRVYVDSAGQQFGAAQHYVTERVKERPVTATMAGVGVGLLLGLLLASGRNNHRSRH
jgi:ElaB/YqjD/DUF883 family membrane-anchored ribosome-binding protein